MMTSQEWYVCGEDIIAYRSDESGHRSRVVFCSDVPIDSLERVRGSSNRAQKPLRSSAPLAMPPCIGRFPTLSYGKVPPVKDHKSGSRCIL